ncbi:MAG: ketopantoate reductase family protein [Leptonema sp. (in: bacteria)]
MNIQNICIIGAGAVGGFYGAKLQKEGYKVQFYSNYLKSGKLKIKSIWGDFEIQANVFNDTKQMEPSELIIISTKTLPEIPILSLVQSILKKNSIVLFLQNGINQEENFKKEIQKNKELKKLEIIILGGLAFTCIHRISSNEIHHIDYGNIKIGSLEKNHHSYAKEITKIFLNAGIQCEFVTNLRKARWEKLLWNVAFNTLSVIGLNVTTDLLVASKDTRILSENLMKEILAISEKEKNSCGRNKIKEMIHKTIKMKPYKTSMLIDYENHKPLEIEGILGEPIKLAEKYKIPTPYLKFCYHILKFLDEQNRKIIVRD